MSSNDVTITENGRGGVFIRPVSGGGIELDSDEVAALRAYFAAERMPEDVQALVDEAREVIDRGVAPGDRAPLRAVLDALEAAEENLTALIMGGAPVRPPVSPEVREAIDRVVREATAEYFREDLPEDGRDETDTIVDAILPRFSVPSQPVYDEEKIARVLWDAAEVAEDTGRDRYPWENVPKDVADWWRAVAAALVAALRGGELTREETNG